VRKGIILRNIVLDDVRKYVEDNIGIFHKNRLDRLKQLKLKDVLKRKNPYLYKAKNVLVASDLIKIITDAYLCSQEEGVFGNFLEGLAIYINMIAYDSKKSSAKGIDLEFDKEGKRYIVTIKSGPNWGNSGQINDMKSDFVRAKRILRTSNSKIEVVAVNGCCYGRDKKPDKGDYYKYCGQRFWEFISGDGNLYIDLIEPLGYRAKEKNVEFEAEYAKVINNFTLEFSESFCINGAIDWETLIKFNSSAELNAK
jgi:hypothetical protein